MRVVGQTLGQPRYALVRLAADSQTKLPQSLLDNLFQLFGLHARYVDLRQGSNDDW